MLLLVKVHPEVVRERAIFKAIRNMPGRKRMGDEKNMQDAARYFDLFGKFSKAQGNVSNMHRRAEYLDKVFDFSVKLTPGGRRATVGLRKKEELFQVIKEIK